jgi:hypothetical protein
MALPSEGRHGSLSVVRLMKRTSSVVLPEDEHGRECIDPATGQENQSALGISLIYICSVRTRPNLLQEGIGNVHLRNLKNAQQGDEKPFSVLDAKGL